MSIIAADKWARLLRILKQHGGIIGTIGSIWRTETAKDGRLMGYDCLGNKYYENKYYMIARSRWVAYNPQVKFEYDASMWNSSVVAAGLLARCAGDGTLAEAARRRGVTALVPKSVLGHNPPGHRVTADWYGWLHYKTDCVPCDDPAKQFINCCGWYHCWLLGHEENMSGTAEAYYPYSTTNQSIYVWDGSSIYDKPQTSGHAAVN